MSKKLKHALHNALHSWVGPGGGYETDIRDLEEGKYSVRDLPNLYRALVEFGGQMDLKDIKGSITVRDVRVCKGRRHYRGREYLIKVVSEREVAFGFVRIVQWKGKKFVTIEVI